MVWSRAVRRHLIHASSYCNAGPFGGKRVLVVGVGNSGSDIAVDFAEGGNEVSIAVRTAPHIIRRLVAGPNDVLQVLKRRMPAPMVDAMAEGIRRGAYGDLEEVGLGRPPVGVKIYVQTQARVPTIDSGASRAPYAQGRSGSLRGSSN